MLFCAKQYKSTLLQLKNIIVLIAMNGFNHKMIGALPLLNLIKKHHQLSA